MNRFQETEKYKQNKSQQIKIKKKWRFCKKWTNLEIKIKKKSFKRKIGNYTGKAKRKIKTVFTEISISSAMFKNSFITKGVSFFHFDFESCYTLEHDILTFSFAFGKWLANKIQLPSSINLLTAKKKLYVLFVFEKNEQTKSRIILFSREIPKIEEIPFFFCWW